MTNYTCIDISTAPLPDAASFLGEPEPHGGIKDPVKQEAYLAEKRAKALEKAALDPDLCRITCIGCHAGERWGAFLCRDEAAEQQAIAKVAELLSPANAVAVTFNGRSFDLVVLQRRALYLGVPFPALDLSRYRSPHIDLMELLSGGDPQRRRSLSFYVNRLGWDDLAEKPLTGEEEAKVFEHGRWEELAASVRRDVEAVRRLAIWAGVIPEGGAP